MVCTPALAPAIAPLIIGSEYFVSLGLDDDAASKLHLEYYTKYGLALRGLTRDYAIGKALVVCSPVRYSFLH
jgi:hypothetical protein